MFIVSPTSVTMHTMTELIYETNIERERDAENQPTVQQNDKETLACVTIELLELHEYTITIVSNPLGYL